MYGLYPEDPWDFPKPWTPIIVFKSYDMGLRNLPQTSGFSVYFVGFQYTWYKNMLILLELLR